MVVAANVTVRQAAEELQRSPAQDIFVTEGGSANEPAIGWISNVRLAKHMAA
jgi:hypothetical protein